jgi:hypothetical protein
MKSLCSSFRYNPWNLENPWYGVWAQELVRITEPFNNIIVVPQYALWFTMSDEEPEYEDVKEIDEDAASEEGDDSDDGEDQAQGEGTNNTQDDSADELDCLTERDTDESTQPITQDASPAPAAQPEQDPDTSFALSLLSAHDGMAPELFPDFVALHILAKELNAPTNAELRRRFERRAGFRIIHECCPVIMEIKPFPGRRLKPTKLKRELAGKLAEALEDLGYQCYHLFKKYEHAVRTIAIAASGDHWSHHVIFRTEVPRGVGDGMDTQTWDSLEFLAPVVLGTPASDARMKEITDYL